MNPTDGPSIASGSDNAGGILATTSAPARWMHRALDGVGMVAFLMALYRFVQLTRCPLSWYDEGIVLSHTYVLMHGGWPFRDFYTQYPPGIYMLMAAIWKVFGVSVMAERILSELSRLAIALLVGVVAGRIIERPGRRVAILPAGVAAIWVSTVPGVPFAWFVALPLAFTMVLVAERALALRSPRLVVATGALWALTFSFRHDLGIYFAVALVPVAGYLLAIWRPAGREVARVAAWLAAGAAPVLVIFWGPTLIAAPWRTIYGDLYADQAHYVLPLRKLPLPPLLDRVDVPFLPFKVPIFLDALDSGCAAVLLAGPALGLWAFFRTRRRAGRGLLAALMTALAAAVLPQACGRSDYNHLVYAVAPSVAIFGALLYGDWRAPLWGRALIPLVVVLFSARVLRTVIPPKGPLWPDVAPEVLDGSPAVGKIPDNRADARLALRGYVAANVAPNETIYVGNKSHESVLINEVDMYFVLDRMPAQRYLQFDPGITTRRPVQQEMIRALEQKKPSVAILSDASDWRERWTPDSRELDLYLEAHYQLDRMVGPYQVLRRR